MKKIVLVLFVIAILSLTLCACNPSTCEKITFSDSDYRNCVAAGDSTSQIGVIDSNINSAANPFK